MYVAKTRTSQQLTSPPPRTENDLAAIQKMRTTLMDRTHQVCLERKECLFEASQHQRETVNGASRPANLPIKQPLLLPNTLNRE